MCTSILFFTQFEQLAEPFAQRGVPSVGAVVVDHAHQRVPAADADDLPFSARYSGIQEVSRSYNFV